MITIMDYGGSYHRRGRIQIKYNVNFSARFKDLDYRVICFLISRAVKTMAFCLFNSSKTI